MMIEGALLSIAGSALALWLARVGLHTLTQVYPTALPRSTELSVDLPVLLFTCGVAMATSMLFGLAQLRQIGVKGLAVALMQAGTRGASGGVRRQVRRGLVVAEVALAVMLVIGAGLLIRTVYNLANVEVGFNKSRLVTFSISLPDSPYPGSMPRVQVYQRLLDVLRAVPGVEAATAMFGLPPNRPAIKNNTHVADANTTAPSVGQFHIVDYYQYVMPDYFETMGIPIVRGRSFQPADATSSGLVAIVNETFAKTFWTGRDPIGQRVKPNPAPYERSAAVVHRRGCGEGRQAGRCGSRNRNRALHVSSAIAKPAPGLGFRRSTTWYYARRSRPRLCHTRSSASSVKWTRLCRWFAFRIWRRSLLIPSSDLASWRSSLASLRAWRCCSPRWALMGLFPLSLRSAGRDRHSHGARRESIPRARRRDERRTSHHCIGAVIGLAGAFGLNRLIASLLFGVRPTDVPTFAGVVATMIIVAAVDPCCRPGGRRTGSRRGTQS